MQYIVKLADGTESQPIDENTLKTWVATGQVTPETQVRNALFNKWKDAGEMRILTETFENLGQETNSTTFTNTAIKIDEEILRGEEKKKTKKKEEADPNAASISLNAPGKFRFVTAPASLRLLAHLTDLLILLLIIGGANAIILLLAPDTVVEAKSFRYGLLGMNLIAYLMYFTSRIGLKAQTYGQLFWGLITVRAQNGGPVFLGRAFFYAVIMLFFGWLSPFLMYVTPTKRTPQDLLTDSRVIKLR